MAEDPLGPVEVDGPERIFEDPLFDHMVGEWDVTGTVAGRKIRQTCDVEWVLNHQFLKIHFVGVDSGELPGGKRRAAYEALVFFGYDNMSERYVAHWLDIFGGRFSEALGYGQKVGVNSVKFVFEYDGPLDNTVSWDEKADSWKMTIRQKNQRGEWTLFADEVFERKRQ